MSKAQASRNPRKTNHPVVVLTTVQLRMLCDQAEALCFSNGPTTTFWQDVDPNGLHVVDTWFVHRPNLAVWKGVDHPWDFTHGGGKNIRALVLCEMRGKTKRQDLLCDFDFQAFMKMLRLRQMVRNRRMKAASTS